ncbi:hypothetical protein EBT23_01365 [bacterium]|nr:hypothetical protein [Verrucomicrobiota bacterium]NBS54215.1 hypothetical protein [bacterium]
MLLMSVGRPVKVGLSTNREAREKRLFPCRTSTSSVPGLVGFALGVLIFLPAHQIRADTLSIYFPSALGDNTGITTSTGASLAGFTVRAGAFSVTPGQLLANLAGNSTAAEVRSTVESSFTEFGSFTMADAYLTDPDQGIITLDGDMASAAIRGKDIYLIFYDNSSPGSASEMAVLRMADRSQAAGSGTGIFPTSAFLGTRNADLYLADVNGLVPAQDTLNLLLGGYDPANARFVLGALAGGIGRITSPTNLTIPAGVSRNYVIQANHGADRFATTNLPVWATLASNGIITLNPPAATGSTNLIGLVASNSVSGKSASASLRLVVQPSSLSFTTTTNLIGATAGVAIDNFTFISTGNSPTYTVTAGNLLGLSLSSQGTLSGIPTSTGTNDVTIQASADGEFATTNFSLAVGAPTITVPTGELTGGQVLATAGVARAVTILKPAGFTNLTGTVFPPTTGVSFNGTSLTIATNALPLAKGTTNLTLTLAANRTVGADTVSASTTVPLRIVAPAPTMLVGTNVVEVDVGQPFSTNIQTDAGSYASLTFSNLPPGLSGLPSGLVSGVNRSISLPFAYPVTVTANSGLRYEGGGVLTSTVTFLLRNTNPPYFSPLTNRILGAVGKNLSLVLTASNFPTAYSASNLPSGLSLAGNTISGTPAVGGIFAIPVTAYNSYRPGSTNPADWQPGFGTVVLSVANSKPAPSLAPVSPGILMKNATISLNDNRRLLDAASSGVMISALGLPPGIFLESSTGRIYGTPTTSGTYAVTVFMQNGKGWTRKAVNLTVQ